MTKMYRRKSNCEVIELDDEIMIMNVDNYTVTEINRVGGFCWSLLETPNSLEEIVEKVKIEFEVSDASVEEDIHSFMTRLIECGLVESE
jgi:hypothetical protein